MGGFLLALATLNYVIQEPFRLRDIIYGGDLRQSATFIGKSSGILL